MKIENYSIKIDTLPSYSKELTIVDAVDADNIEKGRKVDLSFSDLMWDKIKEATKKVLEEETIRVFRENSRKVETIRVLFNMNINKDNFDPVLRSLILKTAIEEAVSKDYYEKSVKQLRKAVNSLGLAQSLERRRFAAYCWEESKKKSR